MFRVAGILQQVVGLPGSSNLTSVPSQQPRITYSSAICACEHAAEWRHAFFLLDQAVVGNYSWRFMGPTYDPPKWPYRGYPNYK